MSDQEDSKFLYDAISFLRRVSANSKPLAVVVAGHNGSGKSTIWFNHLADEFKAPMINADRLLASVLPQPDPGGLLRSWAQALRDTDEEWMAICRKGAEGFTSQAMSAKVNFAFETVFSHWQRRDDGTYASKIDLIQDLQASGYFVLLVFVGLAHPGVSAGRVESRVVEGGHDVLRAKLKSRFRRTQQAIRHAVPLADAAILLDNSTESVDAFTMCYACMGEDVMFDIRDAEDPPLDATFWLDIVVPVPMVRVGRAAPSRAGCTVA